MEEALLIATRQMLDYNKKFGAIFEKTRHEDKDGDFYQDVKPFADEVKDAAERWAGLASSYAQKKIGPAISIQQINTAMDHIETMSIQAFYVKTSRRNFINSNRTVEYTLKTLLHGIEK